MLILDQYLSRLDAHSINQLDLAFAKFLQSLAPSESHLDLLGFVVSAHLGQGHVCLDFSQPHEWLTQQELLELKQLANKSKIVSKLAIGLDAPIDDVTIIEPLVLQGERLYLQRYWLYESQLASRIQSRLQSRSWDLKSQEHFIATLFPKSYDEIDWQAVAACMAAKQGFSVISGGPGTGKTTTVIRLLSLLIQLYQTQLNSRPIIKLVAPTGKAAMRLTESIASAKQGLNVDANIKQWIPEQASTLHRLLKSNGRGEFQYHKYNPLHLDIIIVDEASMVDLPLMAKLFDALPEHAQLILLGDKDQLASVEAGSVLADICDSDNEHGYSDDMVKDLSALIKHDLTAFTESQGSQIRDHICHLRKSYRFDVNSGIGFLAQAANRGNVSQWNQVVSSNYSDLQLLDLSEEQFANFIQQGVVEYGRYLETVLPNLKNGMSHEDALRAHHQFSKFQILCALREGRLGVEGLNHQIEQGLQQKSWIPKEQTWYAGRPVMIMQNDYGLNLYNGDIGLILPRLGEDGVVRLKAAFVGADQHIRWLQPARLPQHETVYAMTVHKSQGSEFEHCALVLPDHQTQVLTKELIYTGITRAKKRLTCIGRSSVIHQALQRKVQRASGLGQRLWRQTDLEPLQADEGSQFSLF